MAYEWIEYILLVTGSITKETMQTGETTPTAADHRSSSLLRDGEFRALWLGRLISAAGDQFARVALSLIAFYQTGSAGLTAVTYAVTFIPSVLGGPLLGGFADRYPRRRVAICCDVSRGALIAVAAIPGIPFAALVPLVFVVSLLEPPSDAVRSALLANVLSGARYVAALTIVQVSSQLAMLAGFVVGGVLVAVVGTHLGLALDAGSFAVSAILTWRGVHHRAAPEGGALQRSALSGLPGTIRLIATHATLSRLAAFTLTACCLVAPEALAAPYVAELGEGPAGMGLFLAAFPLGFTLGGIVMTHVAGPARLLSMIVPAFMLSAVPLICFAAHPGLAVSVALWAASGFAGAPVIAVNGAFVRTVPDDRRGAAGALMGSVVSGGQGLMMIAAGGVAELAGPSGAIATLGVIVMAATALTSVGWRGARAAALTAIDEPVTG
jgi:Major Facilitator Superfamily